MEESKQELINKIKELKKKNDSFIEEITNLVNTEGNRADVLASIYSRKNRELRLKNLWEIENNYRVQAKIFGQLPEKYAIEQESTQRAYVEQINRFMKEYNTAYTNIQIETQKAEEAQKTLMFKCYKFSNSKKMYMLSDGYKNFKAKRKLLINEYEKTHDFNIYKRIQEFQDPAVQYDKKIEYFRKQIKTYEKILLRCDKEFEECTKRREKDFQELFGEDLGIELKKNFGIKSVIDAIMNKIDGKNRFSRFVVKRYANKINEIKTKKMDEYANKIKKESVAFSEEIENMLKNSGV